VYGAVNTAWKTRSPGRCQGTAGGIAHAAQRHCVLQFRAIVVTAGFVFFERRHERPGSAVEEVGHGLFLGVDAEPAAALALR
jgi:hypothetical protein